MRTCLSSRSGLTFSVAIGPDVFAIGFVIRIQAKTAISTAQPQKIVQPDRNIVPHFSERAEQRVRWLPRQITYENQKHCTVALRAIRSLSPSTHKHDTQFYPVLLPDLFGYSFLRYFTHRAIQGSDPVRAMS